jgi:hypothetical protein
MKWNLLESGPPLPNGQETKRHALDFKDRVIDKVWFYYRSGAYPDKPLLVVEVGDRKVVRGKVKSGNGHLQIVAPIVLHTERMKQIRRIMGNNVWTIRQLIAALKLPYSRRMAGEVGKDLKRLSVHCRRTARGERFYSASPFKPLRG